MYQLPTISIVLNYTYRIANPTVHADSIYLLHKRDIYNAEFLKTTELIFTLEASIKMS